MDNIPKDREVLEDHTNYDFSHCQKLKAELDRPASAAKFAAALFFQFFIIYSRIALLEL